MKKSMTLHKIRVRQFHRRKSIARKNVIRQIQLNQLMSDKLKYGWLFSFLQSTKNVNRNSNKFKKMTLKIFIENHFYSLLVFFLVLANAIVALGIINIRLYCCKYCKLSQNGRRIAQLQTNRCDLFVHEQLENANHQPLRLV